MVRTWDKASALHINKPICCGWCGSRAPVVRVRLLDQHVLPGPKFSAWKHAEQVHFDVLPPFPPAPTKYHASSLDPWVSNSVQPRTQVFLRHPFLPSIFGSCGLWPLTGSCDVLIWNVASWHAQRIAAYGWTKRNQREKRGNPFILFSETLQLECNWLLDRKEGLGPSMTPVWPLWLSQPFLPGPASKLISVQFSKHWTSTNFIFWSKLWQYCYVLIYSFIW